MTFQVYSVVQACGEPPAFGIWEFPKIGDPNIVT